MKRFGKTGTPSWNTLNTAEQHHYSRQCILPGFGPEKQELLKAAKILVVGAGGLGCPALLYLAGAGVGTLGIMDGDVVEQSNLHRQVLYTMDNLKVNKAEAATQHLSKANPYIRITPYKEPLTASNALKVLSSYDVIIDGTDNFATRYLINDACVILGKPFVYGAIFQYEGQLSVFNYQGGPTYRCLFPTPPAFGEVPNCTETGVLGVVPGLIGTWQALEALKILTGLGQVRSGELLLINLLNNTQHTLNIPVVPENKALQELSDYQALCGEGAAIVPEITANTLKKLRSIHNNVLLLDVREPREVEAFTLGGVAIPLHQLPQRLEELPHDRDIVTVCQSGHRSKRAAQMLLKAGFTHVKSLKGGLVLWKE